MKFKSITTIVVLLLLVASLSVTGCTTSTTNQTNSADNTSTRTVEYSVVDEWGTGTALLGQRIVVPTSYLNDAKMKELGKQLMSDVKGYKSAFIIVFTDRAAALIQKAGANTEAEHQAIADHYIGNFDKNDVTGQCEFYYCLGGFVNNKDCQTITCNDLQQSSSSLTPTPPLTTTPNSITNKLSSDTSFTTFVRLLNKANLSVVLDRSGNFTVFAPDNAAFSKLNATTLAALENSPALREVLMYHIVPTKLQSNSLVGSGTLTTMSGLQLPYSVTGTTIKIGGATIGTISSSDNNSTNGVIHRIDTVLVPPSNNNS
jgi:uncharacterized surface protein with fasciclin (FAS1) repeats